MRVSEPGSPSHGPSHSTPRIPTQALGIRDLSPIYELPPGFEDTELRDSYLSSFSSLLEKFDDLSDKNVSVKPSYIDPGSELPACAQEISSNSSLLEPHSHSPVTQNPPSLWQEISQALDDADSRPVRQRKPPDFYGIDPSVGCGEYSSLGSQEGES